jgi:hypothetical protein
MKAQVLTVSLLGLFLAIVNTIAQGTGVILGQTTWTAGNGHSYAIVEFPEETWASASADIAVTLPGYHLTTITTQAEQDFVWDFMVKTTGGGLEWWLGGFQDVAIEIDPAEGWEWVTGEPWAYTNWAFGEPNNAGGIEDHLALDFGGLWNDEGTAISIIKGYVAETVPIPTAVLLFGSGLLGLIGMAKRKKA